MNKPLLFSWIISIIATIGSLFFSEYLHFVPCTLCWYQRILMYPLVFLLGRAFYEGNSKIYAYILPLSILGILVSGYHYSLQKIPALQQFEMCTSGVPCSGEYINWLGFITIPLLAFVAFLFITFSMVILARTNKND
ncbi:MULTISPECIES: disulfide oxidoreductase [Bacillaceae]|uniref:Probable disulfide formation protein n=1 Tax=Peribacillus huizhouensis TaxID=1501239 RepID=A0ABR6CT05_9BACI|nr:MULTISPECIES: disulfide oxidoreductase [Bacillaceae]MBA9028150.1 disulfide bond formation protein DsbB [Peribacillus huizhouensis]